MFLRCVWVGSEDLERSRQRQEAVSLHTWAAGESKDTRQTLERCSGTFLIQVDLMSRAHHAVLHFDSYCFLFHIIVYVIISYFACSLFLSYFIFIYIYLFILHFHLIIFISSHFIFILIFFFHFNFYLYFKKIKKNSPSSVFLAIYHYSCLILSLF